MPQDAGTTILSPPAAIVRNCPSRVDVIGVRANRSEKLHCVISSDRRLGWPKSLMLQGQILARAMLLFA